MRPQRGRAKVAGVSRAGIVGFLLLAAVIAFVLAQSMSLEAHVCEVCMQYRGGSQCRTVGGATEDEARQGAIVNACAFLSSGVTDSMACQRQPPLRVDCR
jgi:hypothetical protein